MFAFSHSKTVISFNILLVLQILCLRNIFILFYSERQSGITLEQNRVRCGAFWAIFHTISLNIWLLKSWNKYLISWLPFIELPLNHFIFFCQPIWGACAPRAPPPPPVVTPLSIMHIGWHRFCPWKIDYARLTSWNKLTEVICLIINCERYPLMLKIWVHFSTFCINICFYKIVQAHFKSLFKIRFCSEPQRRNNSLSSSKLHIRIEKTKTTQFRFRFPMSKYYFQRDMTLHL